MLKKFFLILTLILVPLTANAELYVDTKSQIQFEIPEGWRILSDREKADLEISMSSMYFLPTKMQNGFEAIRMDITKTTNGLFLSTNSGSRVLDSAKLWGDALNTTKGHDLLETRPYSSPAGNGILAAYITGDLFNLAHRISSPKHSVHFQYFTDRERLLPETSKILDLCLPVINSIKFPE